MHESAIGTKLLNARALVCPEELEKADMRRFGGIRLLTRHEWPFLAAMHGPAPLVDVLYLVRDP